MNILHITNQLDVGGITTYILYLSKALIDRGHNVFVASYEGEFLPRCINSGINYISIPIKTKSEISPKMIKSYFRLKREIRANNIQIIHAHTRTTQVLGHLLGKKFGIPYIATCHGFYKTRFFRRMFGCWGDKTIAISQPVKEHLIKDFKVKEENIHLIHTGIDVDRFSLKSQAPNLKLREELKLGDEPVIGIIARLSPEKGHNCLVEAMPAVLREFPLVKLIMVGDGREKQALKELVIRLGLEKNILFIHSVMQTADILPALDIFVMPSLSEGLGISLLEAMATGLPVVGTRVGGIPSLIKDKENGLLVEPGDSSALAIAILELLKDKDMALALGSNARDFVRDKFSLKDMGLNVERVYLECLNQKN